MRLFEILSADYNSKLRVDLGTLLTGAIASGATSIPTDQLVNELVAMGYAVTTASIAELLTGNPQVMGVTPTEIKLSTPNSGGEDDNDSADQVSSMAQKATHIR